MTSARDHAASEPETRLASITALKAGAQTLERRCADINQRLEALAGDIRLLTTYATLLAENFQRHADK